ncbi:helicase-related protein, partial [Candidatus Omnitrophota bacterium]
IREIVMTNVATGKSEKLIPGVSVFEINGVKYLFTVENGSNITYLVNKTKKDIDPIPVEFKASQEYVVISGKTYQLQLRNRESHSAKIQALDEIVSDVVDQKQEKLAIFTGFVKTVSDLKERYEKRGFKVLTITGVASLVQRKKIIDTFQSSSEPFILISTYQTTGESIDLTAARYGVLVDSPWIDRDQIIRRLFRIGQENDVRFTILNARNSIDDHIEQVNWEADMIQKIVLSDISSVYKANDSLMKLYVSAGADRKKEHKQLESFREKIASIRIFDDSGVEEEAKKNILKEAKEGGLSIRFDDNQLEAVLFLDDGKTVEIKDFSHYFRVMERLSDDSKKFVGKFLINRFASEHANQIPVKKMILWNICETLIPGFKDIDYDGRLEFIVELGSYIIGRLIDNPQITKEQIFENIQDVPDQLYEQTLYYLDTANIFKLFSLLGLIPQTYFYEGELLRYNPPLRMFYFNSGIQYFDENIVDVIAPDWRKTDQEALSRKEGFEQSTEMVRPLTESEEKRLANQIRLGNKAAEKVLVLSRLRDIVKIAKRVKYRMEGLFWDKVRGAIDVEILHVQGQNILFDLVRDYAAHEIYYNRSLSEYLVERLNPRMYSKGFVMAKEIMSLQGDNLIKEDGNTTLLDMQSNSSEVLDDIDNRESIEMLRQLLTIKGFSYLEIDIIILFTFEGYTEDELALEYADKQDREPQEDDLDIITDILSRFRDSMKDFGKDALLKIIRDGDMSDIDEETSDDVGGVDFRLNTMPLTTYGKNILMDIPEIEITDIDPATFSGFTSFIIDITPISNVVMLLGNVQLKASGTTVSHSSFAHMKQAHTLAGIMDEINLSEEIGMKVDATINGASVTIMSRPVKIDNPELKMLQSA